MGHPGAAFMAILRDDDRGFEKIMSGAANVGFLAHAALKSELARPTVSVERASELTRLIWNDRVDAVMTAIFILVVWIILADSLRVWARLLPASKERIPRAEEAAA